MQSVKTVVLKLMWPTQAHLCSGYFKLAAYFDEQFPYFKRSRELQRIEVPKTSTTLWFAVTVNALPH